MHVCGCLHARVWLPACTPLTPAPPPSQESEVLYEVMTSVRPLPKPKPDAPEAGAEDLYAVPRSTAVVSVCVCEGER